MKKTQEKHSEQNNSVGVNSDAKTIQSSVERTSNITRGQKKRRPLDVTYEEGDLRGIVAEALAKSTDPYIALSESGVIKNAAEFFNSD
jgi:hypothetical protein